MAAGALAGWLVPGIAAYAEPVARSFLRLIQSVIAPVLVTTLIGSFARGGKLSDLGRLGWKSLVWFESSTTFALLLGWAMVSWFRPGAGVGLSGTVAPAAAPDFGRVVENMFPASLFDAMARGDVLQVVLGAIALGISCAAIGAKAEPFVVFCESVSAVAFQYTRYVMNLAAVGVAAAIAATVARSGIGVLAGLGKFVVLAWVTQGLFLVLGVAVPLLVCRVPLGRFWEHAREPFLIAFGTTSSAAALPSAMGRLQHYGLPKALLGLVLPLGLSFNLCGSTIHLVMATFFVAQAADVALTLPQELMILLTLKLTSKGVAGIPRANFVILTSLFPSYALPLEGLAALLGIDAAIDPVRTGNNVLANCAGPVVIARWEGWKPPERPDLAEVTAAVSGEHE
jgi:proton glutamate symport protein